MFLTNYEWGRSTGIKWDSTGLKTQSNMLPINNHHTFFHRTTGLALLLRLVVIAVTLAARVIEGHALVITGREGPTSQFTTALTDLLGSRALLCSTPHITQTKASTFDRVTRQG